MCSSTPRAQISVSCLILLMAASSVCADQPLAIFHVGNSLTDQAYGMHDIAEARGHDTKFGRHMIPGAPLQWLWEHRDKGFRTPDGKKPADDILKDDKWDCADPATFWPFPGEQHRVWNEVRRSRVHRQS